MFALWTQNVPFLLDVTSGGMVLIPIAASALARQNVRLWPLTLCVAASAAAMKIAIEFADRSIPSNNILDRDIGAIAVLAFACPTVSSLFIARSARRSALARGAVATGVVIAFALIAPFFVIIAHCTSGDCF